MEQQQIGRYTLIETIGTGGMSTVHLAVDNELGREVALKLLPTQLSRDEMFLRRFRREARLVARLEHPHIVPLYGYDTHETGQPYLVMRLLRGGTLKDRLRAKEYLRGNLDYFWQIIVQVAGALTAAHDKNVIHRDIKPTNILFDENELAFVSDFGISKQFGSLSMELTATNAVMGTPAYMSPEQCSGSQELSMASDQYSFALLVYEGLTGELLFEGSNTMQMMYKHVHEPVPVHKLKSYPPHIVSALERALAKRPEDRFPSVADFATALTNQPVTLGRTSGYQTGKATPENSEDPTVVKPFEQTEVIEKKPKETGGGSKAKSGKEKKESLANLALDEDYEEARDAYNQKDWARAIRILNGIIRVNPNYRRAMEMRRAAQRQQAQAVEKASRAKTMKDRPKDLDRQIAAKTKGQEKQAGWLRRRPWWQIILLIILLAVLVATPFMLGWVDLTTLMNGAVVTQIIEDDDDDENDDTDQGILDREEDDDDGGATSEVRPTSPPIIETDLTVDDYLATLTASDEAQFVIASVSEVVLSNGAVVVDTNDQSVQVTSRFGDQVTLMPDSMVGIIASEDDLQAHCFSGTCVVRGSVSGNTQLTSGQQVSVGISGIPNSDTTWAQNGLFAFAAMVPTPTATPTETPTATPTATPVPPTAAPTALPPTATPAQAEDLTDSDGDGVPDSIDVCDDPLRRPVDEQGCWVNSGDDDGGDGGVIDR